MGGNDCEFQRRINLTWADVINSRSKNVSIGLFSIPNIWMRESALLKAACPLLSRWIMTISAPYRLGWLWQATKGALKRDSSAARLSLPISVRNYVIEQRAATVNWLKLLVERLGVKVEPQDVRLQPSEDSCYAWSVMPGKEYLLDTNLGRGCTGLYQEIQQHLGSTIEAVTPQQGHVEISDITLDVDVSRIGLAQAGWIVH